MNQAARGHLANAERHLSRGESSYHRAAEEVTAAVGQGATWGEIAESLGKSERWIRHLTEWHHSGSEEPTPFSGSAYADRQAAGHARRVLRDAPIETVERMVADLPPERRAAVARAVHETHPATQTRPPLTGVRESITRMETNTPLSMLMGGALARLTEATDRVLSEWDTHAFSEGRTDEEREIVQEIMRDEAAKLIARTSNPEELLR